MTAQYPAPRTHAGERKAKRRSQGTRRVAAGLMTVVAAGCSVASIAEHSADDG